MDSQPDRNFALYKEAETKALDIVAQMKQGSAKKVDIELALLTALFELHRGILPPATIASIVRTHLETLVPFYESALQETGPS
jgi:hypothetical protein